MAGMRFTFPEDPRSPRKSNANNLLFDLGEHVNITWFATLDTYMISISHHTEPGFSKNITNIQTYDGNGAGEKWYNWKVDNHGTSLALSPVFNFQCLDGLVVYSGVRIWSSANFNITETRTSSPAASISTLGLSSSTPSTRPSSTSSVSTTSLATASTTLSLSSDTPSGGSSSTLSVSTTPERSNSMTGPNFNAIAIGAGTGAGIGVAVLLIGAFFFWRRHTGRNEAKDSQSSGRSMDAACASQPMAAMDPDISLHSAPGILPWQSDPEVLP